MCIICVVCDAGNQPAPVCVNLEPIQLVALRLAGISWKHACMQLLGSVLTGTAGVSRLELQQAATCAVPLTQNAEAKATGLVE